MPVFLNTETVHEHRLVDAMAHISKRELSDARCDDQDTGVSSHSPDADF